MKLRPYDPARDQNRWDEFVLSQKRGSFFHLARWHSVIDQSYRSFKPQYHYVEDNGEWLAVLPATAVTRPFAGTALISNPYAVSAGPLCAPGIDPIDVVNLVSDAAKSYDYIELRDIEEDLPEPWQTHQHFANFEKKLSTDHDENWLAIPNRQRAVIRKAEQHNLSFELHHDLERFLSVYAVSLRNLGTPIYPKKYFRALLEAFKDDICVATVAHQGIDLTTVLSFKHGNRLMPYYGGGVLEARHYHAYPWMYWQLMKYGVEHQMPLFDFGRSPVASGAYSFKKNLGFKPRRLNYASLPITGSAPDLTGESKLARLLIQVWQHLPVQVTRVLGPTGAVYAV